MEISTVLYICAGIYLLLAFGFLCIGGLLKLVGYSETGKGCMKISEFTLKLSCEMADFAFRVFIWEIMIKAITKSSR